MRAEDDPMSEWANDHRCYYYADPSGGFDWPRCVICGRSVGTEEAHGALRLCCRTRETERHLAVCSSMDARAERGQPAFGPIS